MNPQQTWDPQRYAQNARFVADLGMPVVEWLDPQPGERVLDLGCGDGALTAKLVALGCTVVGIDSSTEQVNAAKARGLDARVIGGEAMPFENEFDAVFSNAALHWIKTPDAVIAGVHRALKPRGRFVGEFGGAGNVFRIEAALSRALTRRGVDAAAVNPWYFPTVEEYRQKLESAGLEVSDIRLIPRPTPLPGDITGWLETFAESFTSTVPAEERPELIAEVRDELRADLCDSAGQWSADYVRLRFTAVKPA